MEVGGKSDILERIETGDAQLRDRDVAKGIDFINPIYRSLNRGVGRCYIVLNRRAQRAECTCEEGVYLEEALREQ